MAWSERVLTGRASRSQGGSLARGLAGRALAPAAGAGTGAVTRGTGPLVDEATRAQLAEVRSTAEAEGWAAGRAAGEQSLAAAVAAAVGFAQRLETAIPKDVDMVARTVAELAVVIARRIVAAELRHDPAVLVAAIEAGVRHATGASVITVELHPAVVADVERAWAARHGARHRGISWSFTGDPTLPPDGCRLRTEHGVVEAGLEDQLAEVAAALDAAIPGYLSSALGTASDPAHATSGRRAERAAPEPAQSRVTTPPPAASPESPATAALPDVSTALDDLDLDALAGLGLADLDALARAGLDGEDPG
jgi:flagellar biosynthesis/type III secretory pathway protein FliH